MDLFNVSFRTSTLFERDSAKAEHLTKQKHVRNVERGMTRGEVVQTSGWESGLSQGSWNFDKTIPASSSSQEFSKILGPSLVKFFKILN